MEKLFYQFVHKLEAMGVTDRGAVFIDGTKLESRAGRYTFVWRKTVEKQLAQVKDKLKSMTGMTTSTAVRSMLEGEAKKSQFVSARAGRKAGYSGTGRRRGAFWSGGRDMRNTFHYGPGTEQLRKDRHGCRLHADKGIPHERWTAKTRV